jgi:excisionase family DNA binding protein
MNIMETSVESRVEPIYLSIADAMVATGLSQPLLYQHMRTRKLPFFKVGKRRLIRRDDLIAWVERSAKQS